MSKCRSICPLSATKPVLSTNTMTSSWPSSLTKKAKLFVPDGTPDDVALARTTHLAIGAHPDDLEFMAFHGICTCYQQPNQWFGGITCTDGAGGPRSGPYAELTQDQYIALRQQEQEAAARIGDYSFVLQCGYASSAVRSDSASLAATLHALLNAVQPEVVYVHNPADKHPTHIAVLRATIDALRALPRDRRPQKMLGCEVWRDLDWMTDNDKVLLDVSRHEELAQQLNAAFVSQIDGGKQYDQAIAGRRRAHATFHNAHAVDQASSMILAMDLTPLLQDDQLDVADFTLAHIDRFRASVQDMWQDSTS